MGIRRWARRTAAKALVGATLLGSILAPSPAAAETTRERLEDLVEQSVTVPQDHHVTVLPDNSGYVDRVGGEKGHVIFGNGPTHHPTGDPDIKVPIYAATTGEIQGSGAPASFGLKHPGGGQINVSTDSPEPAWMQVDPDPAQNRDYLESFGTDPMSGTGDQARDRQEDMWLLAREFGVRGDGSRNFITYDGVNVKGWDVYDVNIDLEGNGFGIGNDISLDVALNDSRTLADIALDSDALGTENVSVGFRNPLDPDQLLPDYSLTHGAAGWNDTVLENLNLEARTQGCTPGPTTLCLNNGRFRVNMDWETNVGTSGLGQGVQLTNDSGYFWFFQDTNVEVVVKVLDASVVNNKYWVFAAGLTNVGTTLTVTDTETGLTREYNNQLNQPFQPLQDTQAFPGNLLHSNVEGSALEDIANTAGNQLLQLSNDRYEVSVNWRTPQGDTGVGNAVQLTPDTGYFWFFDDDNIEMIVKVLDACSFADRFWVFGGGLTNVGVEMTVKDTLTGEENVYVNSMGTAFAPIQDTDAFETCDVQNVVAGATAAPGALDQMRAGLKSVYELAGVTTAPNTASSIHLAPHANIAGHVDGVSIAASRDEQSVETGESFYDGDARLHMIMRHVPDGGYWVGVDPFSSADGSAAIDQIHAAFGDAVVSNTGERYAVGSSPQVIAALDSVVYGGVELNPREANKMSLASHIGKVVYCTPATDCDTHVGMVFSPTGNSLITTVDTYAGPSFLQMQQTDVYDGPNLRDAHMQATNWKAPVSDSLFAVGYGLVFEDVVGLTLFGTGGDGSISPVSERSGTTYGPDMGVAPDWLAPLPFEPPE